MENADERLEKLASEIENIADLYNGYWSERVYEGRVIVEVETSLSTKQYIELCDYLVQHSLIEDVDRQEPKDIKGIRPMTPCIIIDCSDKDMDKIEGDWKQNKDKTPFKYIRGISRASYEDDFHEELF
jgi:hypothetical protein